MNSVDHADNIRFLIDNQKELWFQHEQLPEQHPGISCGGQYTISGPLDVKLFYRALKATIDTDELFTATLSKDPLIDVENPDPAFPYFILGRHPLPDYKFVDISHYNDPEKEAKVREKTFVETKFKPLGGKLCRFLLLKLDDRKYIFLSFYVHLVTDGINVLAHYNRICRLYSELKLTGEAHPQQLKSLKMLRDDEIACKSKPRFQKDVEFWKQRMEDLKSDFIFPNLPGTNESKVTISRLELDFPSECTDLLALFSESEKVSSYAVLLALEYLALSRTYDRDDFVILVPMRFISSKLAEQTSGYTVNVVPMQLKIDQQSSFRELVRTVSTEILSMVRHARCAWQPVLRDSGNKINSDPRGMTTWVSIKLDTIDPQGAENIAVRAITSKHDQVALNNYLIQSGKDDKLHLSIDYSDIQFTKSSVERHFERYFYLLEQCLRSPDRPLYKIDFLLDNEKRRLDHCEAGWTEEYETGSITEIIKRRSHHHPENIAIIDSTGSVTYDELMKRVQVVSGSLVDAGIKKGEAVAVLAHRHPRLSEVILGIMNTGAVYVPITSDMPVERIQRILDEADVKLVLLIKDKDVELIPPSIATLDVNHLKETENKTVTEVNPEDTAYIIFTSGSTGRPKGVRVPHRAIVNTAQYQSKFLKISAKDKVLQFASPSFDASLSEIFMALFNGASLYHASRELIDEPWQLRKKMSDLGISVTTFPPSYLRLFNHAEFPSLRVLLTAGETPNSEDVNYYYKKLDYINAYGPTEAAICAAMKRIKSSDKSKPITLGRPTSNTKVMILDRNLRRLPPGIPGEICLSGVGLADGYLDNSQTKESFIETHFENGGRLYKTGDIGLWTDDGELLYLGRRDGQVKIHGHRVELREIEYQINLIKEILQTVVVFSGEGSSDKSLTAYYVPTNKKHPIGSKEIREYLRQKLPAYMIPLRFICLDSIPTTRSGKIDSQKLQEGSRQQDTVGEDDTQNPAVEKIRPLLTDILGDKATIGSQSDLYSLGIDSIKMMRLAHQISERFGIDCTFRDLVQLNTVQEIANLVDNNLDKKSSIDEFQTRRDVMPDEKLELTEAQRQLWTLHQMDNNPAEYAIPLLLKIKGSEEKVNEFQDAIKQAVELQPVYRLRFESDRDTGKPYIILNDSSGFSIDESDLSKVENPFEQSDKVIDRLIHQKYDLSHPPLIRCSSIKLPNNEFKIVLCMHHIVGDAQSLFGLINDAFEIMDGKEVSPIPSSLIQEITSLESAYLKSEEADNDLAFFDALLTPVPVRLDLFQSKTRCPRRLGNGDHIHKRFGKDVLDRISNLASESGTTSLGVWIALVQGFLALKTGKTDISTAIPVSTRQKKEWEKAAGYFVNTAVVRTSLHSDLSIDERIAGTAKTLKRILSHSRYPFLRLATELGIKRDPSRSPVVDILATWSDEPAESFSRNGLEVSLPQIDLKSAKYDAVFLFRNLGGNSSEIVFEYDTDLADKKEAVALLEEFSLYLLHVLSGKKIPIVSQVSQSGLGVPVSSQEDSASAVSSIDSHLWSQLAESWKTILGNTFVDAETDFFESGGDSIKAIRLVSSLRQKGLNLRPAKLFEKPQFSDLYNELSQEIIETSSLMESEGLLDVSESGFTPIQQWLVKKYPNEWEHFQMSILLEIPIEIDSHTIREILEGITCKHIVLQSKFDLDEGILSASLSDKNHLYWKVIEGQNTESETTVLRKAIEEFNEWIDVKNGRLFGAVLIKSESEQQLMVAGHHLVLDAVSMGIIIDEIQQYLLEGRLPEGKEFEVGNWLKTLRSYAGSHEAQLEKKYWEKKQEINSHHLPIKNRSVQDRIHDKQNETIHISSENSGKLEEKYSGRRYGLLPLLLASFSSSFRQTFDEGDLLIQLEGHGRSLDSGENAGNGVGWFTAPYPFKLPILNYGYESYDRIENELKEVPNNGATYGTLYPLAENDLNLFPEIAFNFIPIKNSANREVAVKDPYSLDKDWLKYLIHPDFSSSQPLEATVTHDSKGLHLSLRYHPEKLDEEWIKAVLSQWEKALIEEVDGFISTCDNDSLDYNEIVEKTGSDISNIEAVYPLTSSQEGMYYQSRLEGTESTSYTELIEFHFNSDLDAQLLEIAWRNVVRMHQGLRTCFIGLNNGNVRQVVLKNTSVSFKYTDLTKNDSDAIEERFHELQKLWKETVFNLSNGPLIHVHIVKTGKEETRVIWNCHHILIDGWCIGILLEDLFKAYRDLENGKEAIHLNHSSLFPYFKWLKKLDMEKAKVWWKRTLNTFGATTTLLPDSLELNETITPQYNEITLPEETTERLKDQSRQTGISLPTLIETAWALILGALHNTNDVVFGVVTLGRPWDVKGMDKAIGNFIHTLPCRVRYSDENTFAEVTGKVQAFTFEMQENEYLPLADILSEHPSGSELFDHFLDFHPLNKADVNNDNLPEILGVSGNEKIPYPYSLNVVDDKELILRQYYNAAVLPEEFVEVLGRYLLLLLNVISESSIVTVSDISDNYLKDLRDDLLGTLDVSVDIKEPNQFETGEGYKNLDHQLIKELLVMYKEVLQVKSIRPEDSFLESGGHSLSALRLLLKVEGRFGLKLELREFFKASSVLDIARSITNKSKAGKGETGVVSENLDVKEYDLSSVQERLWFLQRLTPDAGSYNIFYALRLQGELNLPALEKALSSLLIRHPALRIRVPDNISQTGNLKQRFADPIDTDITFMDLSKDTSPEDIARETINRSVWKPFRFGWNNELFRFEIYKLADNDNILNMVFHHLVLDGWSSEIIRRELAIFYEAACKKQQPEIEDYPVHFTDFIQRHKRLLDSDEGKAIKDRWISRLTPLPEPIDLPIDHQRPATRSQNGGVDSIVLEKTLTERLFHFAGQQSVTVFPVLLSAVKVLLSKLSGQNDIVVGTPVSGRNFPNMENIVGCFVNTVALRDKIEPDLSFEELVKRVSLTILEAVEDQLYPFETLVDDLNVTRDPSRNPIFDILVAIQDSEEWDPKFADIKGSAFPLEMRFSKFDLSFYFFASKEKISLQLEYAKDLFEDDSIKTFLDRFAELLSDLMESPEIKLQNVSLLTEIERQELVEGFNKTAYDHPIENSYGRVILESFKKYKNEIALRLPDESLSYGSFIDMAMKVAESLKKEGVENGHYILVHLERSKELLAAIYGAQLAGCVYVPIDSAIPAGRIETIIKDIGDCLMITDHHLAQNFKHLSVKILTIEKCLEIEVNDVPDISTSPDSLAYTIFTSGSTGVPKGVTINHRSLLNRLYWMQKTFKLSSDDVLMLKTSISFDVSIWELFWWSMSGASLAVLPQKAEREPSRLIDEIEKHGVTVIHFVPSMLRMFIETLERKPDEVKKLKSLRYVIASGEALTSDLVERFNRILHLSNGTELHNLYGPTEATVDVTWQPCTNLKVGKPVPIGRPIDNTQIYILDEEKCPVPIGSKGEIVIGGVQVADGYINREELNGQKFIENPFKSGERVYLTGDYGRWNQEGTIEYLGRMDSQVKVRGFRIELQEIENVLESIKGISQAAVLVSDADGLAGLDCYLLPEEKVELDKNNIRSNLAKHLPEYMIPGRFFILDELPVTSSGKLDRKNLHGNLLGGKKRIDTQVGDVETKILKIWKKILPDTDIGLNDTFFEVGGDSLRLIRLHENMDEEWPGIFTLAELFSYVTIHDQAEVIRNFDSEPGAVEVKSRKELVEEPVAIIGMAVRLADFDDLDHFWADLLAGADRVGELPEGRKKDLEEMLSSLGYGLEDFRYRVSAYLDDIAGFDYSRFRLAPVDASMMEPEHRVFLETALHALEDGGYGGDALDGANVGVFVGSSPSAAFRDAVATAYPDRLEQSFVLNVPSNLATRLSYLKNWDGPAALVDTACSSALNAIHLATQAIHRGECEMALVGGVKIMHMPLIRGEGFSIDSASGRTHAFDASASGTGSGEGAVAFLLKPLSVAKRDGDPIHSVILGSAVNQDGRSAGIAAPNPKAQAEVIKEAMANAKIFDSELDFIEAHGTGTVLGDPVEIEGVTRAVSNGKTKLAIGSVKGNYGHLDAAAGAIGVAKAVMSLKNSVFPHQPFYEQPNPRIDFDRAPVFVPKENTKLEKAILHGGISSFGLSGVNVHIILQNAPERDKLASNVGWCMVPVSASSEDGLRDYINHLAEFLVSHPEYRLEDISATLALGRDHLEYRTAICAQNTASFIEQLLDITVNWGRDDLDSIRTGKVTIPKDPDSVGIEVFKDVSDAKKAAELFISGANPRWHSGNGHQNLSRVHLPPSPFNRKRCWPKFAGVTQKHAHVPGSNGFLKAAVKTAQGTFHPLDLKDQSFWPLHEHLVAEIPTLVGMGWISILHSALKSQTGENPIRIENLSWLQPLRLSEIETDTISLEIDQNKAAKLVGQGIDGQWKVFSEAKISEVIKGTDNKLDINSLQSRLKLDPDFKNIESNGLVKVSERWACRKKLWASSDGSQRLAELELGEKYGADLVEYPLHPALMDVAVSLALNTDGYLPAACGAVSIYRPLEKHIFALSTTQMVSANRIQSSCQIFNKRGEILVELKDMLFLRLIADDVTLYRIDWKETDTELETEVVTNPKRTLLISSKSKLEKYSLKAENELETFELHQELNESLKAIKETLKTEFYPRLIVIPDFEEEESWSIAEFLKEIMNSGFQEKTEILVVGSGAVAQKDSEENLIPESGVLAGLAASIGWEDNNLFSHYVDVDDFTTINEIQAEFAHFQDDPLKAYSIIRNGKRFEREIVPINFDGYEEKDFDLDGDSTIVITGGLGAMGLTFAEILADWGINKFALLDLPQAVENEDRSEFAQTILNKLEKQNISINKYGCDVSDRNGLKSILVKVRKDLGPISGVIHTAGVPGGGFLINKEKEEWVRVLAPKIKGTRFLHELTLNDPLKLFVIASSRTGLTGAPGQTDYSAANSYQDSFAYYRRSHGLPALAIDWATWEKAGMAVKSGAVDQTSDTVLPEDAKVILLNSLKSGEAQIVVSGRQKPKQVSKEKPRGEKAEVSHSKVTIESIGAIWMDILGYDHTIKAEEDFFELGGDSITGMQVISRIQERTGKSISLADLFSYSTLESFVENLGPDKENISDEIEERGEQDYPVLWEQTGIIRESLLNDTGTAFNLPIFLLLPEEIEFERFALSLKKLIDRHEILRTTFILDNEEQRMSIQPSIDFKLHNEIYNGKFDLETLSDELIQPFGLNGSHLFRAKCFTFESGEKLFFFDIHHSLADAPSLDILMADLAGLYDGVDLPPLKKQLKDLALERRGEEYKKRDEDAKKYWVDLYRGDIPKLELPADFPRPGVHTYKGKVYEFKVGRGLTGRLRKLAGKLGTTTFNLFLSAWSILLQKYSSQSDLVIATALDERDTIDLARTPGILISLVPVRMSVNPDLTIKEFVKENHLAITQAMKYRSFNLTRILGELVPEPTPERTPLMEISFSYMNGRRGTLSEGHWSKVENLTPKKESSKADISIFGTELEDEVIFLLEYYSDLFSEERMERMGQHLIHLFGQLLEKDNADQIASLTLVNQQEKDTLQHFAGEVEPLPEKIAIHDLVVEYAFKAPEAIAVVDKYSQLTYSELAGQAKKVAFHLLDMGVQKGEFIAIDVKKEVQSAELILGILMAGAAYLPLDSDLPENRLKKILADAESRFLISSDKTFSSNTCKVIHPDSFNETVETEKKLPVISGHDPAYLMYTSGSTGEPKGVVIPHRAIYRLVRMTPEIELTSQDCVLQAGNVAFDASTWELWGALVNGARVVFVDKEDLLESDALKNLIERYDVTVMWLTSSLCNSYADEYPEGFSGLNKLLTGGEKLSVKHIRKIAAVCPDLTLINGYGPTENTTFTAIHTIEKKDLEGNSIPVGRPIGNTTIHILDPESGLCPVGVWGELCTGGDGLALGYWKDENLTNERFIPDPFTPGKKLYRTGDFARWRSDGVIEFLGRRDDQVKIRGFRIELSEIENVLGEIEGIRQAAVIINGEGINKKLVGCVVVENELDNEFILEQLRRDLHSHMVPSLLIQVEKIPLTSNGKTDRDALREKLQKNAPKVSDDDCVEKLSGENEHLIGGLFSDLLKDEGIQPSSNFMELGGHSLMIFRLINRIAEATGKRLTVRDVMSNPTVRSMAKLLESVTSETDKIPLAEKSDKYPLSHAQQRVYMQHQLEGAETAYNMPMLFRFGKDFNTDVFSETLVYLTERHAALRTGFINDSGELSQFIQDKVDIEFEVDDLRGKENPLGDAVLKIRSDFSRPFDLTKPPLLRTRICRTEDDTYYCAICMHHVIGDGWSLRVFFSELSEIYKALDKKESISLKPLPIQYHDYAVWQKQKDWKKASEYWKNQLERLPEPVALPYDYPAPPQRSYRGANEQVMVDSSLRTAIVNKAGELGITVATYSLGVFAALLYRLARQEDFIIGLGIAGRERKELEDLIGFFVNILPIRISMDEDMDVEELLEAVHSNVQKAIEFQDYPFDLLVRDVIPLRENRRDSFINIVFEYQKFEGVRKLDDLPSALVQQDVDSEMMEVALSTTTKYDVTLFMIEEQDKLLIRAEYDTDRLSKDTVQDWLDGFVRFLEMVSVNSNEDEDE